jgi:hypothetical protein
LNEEEKKLRARGGVYIPPPHLIPRPPHVETDPSPHRRTRMLILRARETCICPCNNLELPPYPYQPILPNPPTSRPLIAIPPSARNIPQTAILPQGVERSNGSTAGPRRMIGRSNAVRGCTTQRSAGRESFRVVAREENAGRDGNADFAKR